MSYDTWKATNPDDELLSPDIYSRLEKLEATYNAEIERLKEENETLRAAIAGFEAREAANP